MSRHAVISGAGIAGPALAHQLGARGWHATVIERFPERRDEGQNIDVRGAAREVARRMGIEDDLRAANTGEIGMRFLDETGSPTASFPVSAPGEVDGPTAELEILRGELSRILIEHTRDSTDFRFDTQISDLTDHGDHVTVTLDDDTAIDADLVVIAEGLRSRTRAGSSPQLTSTTSACTSATSPFPVTSPTTSGGTGSTYPAPAPCTPGRTTSAPPAPC